LRQKAARIERLTPEIRQLVSDMLDTMYDAHGIGLAAPQVGRALRLTVLDVREARDRPSTLLIDDKEATVADFMPLVLVNPHVTPVSDAVNGPEGCLSFPEIFAEVSRPETVEVKAQGADERPVVFRCGGLLAKAIQHEVDHLNGILFIDRISKTAREELQSELDALMAETKASLSPDKAQGGSKAEPRRA
jgi:peptide deformylase